MGYQNALSMAEATDRRSAIEWHCRHNCFPPYPFELVDVAVMAVEAVENLDYDHEIDLPVGIRWRDGSVTMFAADVIEAMRLEAFLELHDTEDYS